MEMLIEQTLATGQQLLSIVIVGVLIAVSAQIMTFIKEKVAQLKESGKFGRWVKYVDIAVNTVDTVVRSLNETVVKEYRVDGKISKTDALKIRDEAIDRITKQLTSSQQEAIEELHGDLNSWILDMIEISVAANKPYKI